MKKKSNSTTILKNNYSNHKISIRLPNTLQTNSWPISKGFVIFALSKTFLVFYLETYVYMKYLFWNQINLYMY